MFAEEDEHSLSNLSMTKTMEQPLANLCRSQRIATIVVVLVVVGMIDDWDFEHWTGGGNTIMVITKWTMKEMLDLENDFKPKAVRESNQTFYDTSWGNSHILQKD